MTGISRTEAKAKLQINPDSLAGHARGFEEGYEIVKGNGPIALGKWLKSVGARRG